MIWKLVTGAPESLAVKSLGGFPDELNCSGLESLCDSGIPAKLMRSLLSKYLNRGKKRNG